jgi:hypothetical protein
MIAKYSECLTKCPVPGCKHFWKFLESMVKDLPALPELYSNPNGRTITISHSLPAPTSAWTECRYYKLILDFTAIWWTPDKSLLGENVFQGE